MKIKIRAKILFVLLFFIVVVFILTFVKEPSNVRLKVEAIGEGFEGRIIEKYAVRNTPPTHLKVETADGNIDIVPYQKVVDESNVGDSIIKPKNENYVYLIKPNGDRKKLFYTKLSLKTRNNKNFPKEWRNKWLESSKYDSSK